MDSDGENDRKPESLTGNLADTGEEEMDSNGENDLNPESMTGDVDGTDDGLDADGTDDGLDADGTDDGDLDVDGTDDEDMMMDIEADDANYDGDEFLWWDVMRRFLNIDYDSLKDNFLEIYKEERTRVKEVLKNLNGLISLSMEELYLARSDEDIVYFMRPAAHFIDDDWNLNKWVLTFSPTWDYEIFPKCLKDWEIDQKMSTLTLGKTKAYCDELIEMVKYDVDVENKKGLQLESRLTSIGCCATMLSSMVESAFNEISDVIDKVQELYWSKPMIPAWYLTTSNLQEALKMEAVGEFTLEKIGDSYEIPSKDEWMKVEAVCKLTESAYKIAKALFETEDATANIYFYNLQELKVILDQEAAGSDCFTTMVAKKMIRKLDSYVEDMFLVLAIATVMDPRCKLKMLEYYTTKFMGDEGNARVKHVEETLRTLFSDYMTRDSTSGPNGSLNISQPLKSDLEQYLDDPVLLWSQDFSVLNWWRSEGHKYPTLSKMARDILAIPLSVATSYDAYLTELKELDPEYIECGREMTNMLMCTRSWSKKRDNTN